MLSRWFLVLLSLASPAIAHAARAAPSVILLPVGGELSDGERRAVNAQVRAALDRFEGIALLGLEPTERNLAGAADMGLACDAADGACVSRLAVLLPADQIIAPTVLLVQGEMNLKLELYDSQTGGLLQRVQRPLPAVGPGRAVLVQQVVKLLLAPEEHLGTLVVQLAPPLTAAFLDAGPAQPGPQARFEAVPEGAHILTAVAGEQTVTQEVEVVAGNTTRVVIALPTPPTDEAVSSEAEPISWVPFASGASLIAVGGLVFLGGALTSGVLLADLFFVDAVTRDLGYNERRLALATSYVAAGVAVAGVAVAAGGVALASIGPVF